MGLDKGSPRCTTLTHAHDHTLTCSALPKDSHTFSHQSKVGPGPVFCQESNGAVKIPLCSGLHLKLRGGKN